MITKFRFENYKSFQNTCYIDFMACTEKSHEDHYAEINGQKVLITAAIHGNNASGKSTCISAFKTMCAMVLNSIIHEDISDFDIKPFNFSKSSKERPTTIEIFFVVNNHEYQYGFIIDTINNKIIEEWLYKKKFSKNKTINHLIFERNEKKIITENKTLKELYKILDDNVLFATLLGRRHIKNADVVFDFFSKFSFYSDNQYVPYETKLGALLEKRVDIKKKLDDLLYEIDPCIEGLEIKKDDLRRNQYRLFGIHRTNEKNKTNTLSLSEESEGTIKFIRILPYILKAFLEGGTIIIDEFDTRFHPLVYRKIISLFYDKSINIKNAQLIFTTHSTILFNSNNMRRDQILLVEKNNNGVSALYSLADFDKLRIDANYEKKYLAGEFGSVPYQHSNRRK